MGDNANATMSPWVPMKSAIDLKHLGKLAEELGELQAAVARCIIQGVDEREPVTGKRNREWLEDEIADVIAGVELTVKHFKLDNLRIGSRALAKEERLREWHKMLAD